MDKLIDWIMKHKLLTIIVLLILAICSMLLAISVSDKGDYDYCVEWDGWIHRDNMIYNCYDFINNTVKCEYGFQDDGTLRVWHDAEVGIGSTEDIYQCSRYVKSKEVKK